MNTEHQYLEVPQGVRDGAEQQPGDQHGDVEQHQNTLSPTLSPHQQEMMWWAPDTTPSSWTPSLRKDHDLPEALPAELQDGRYLPERVPMETDGYSNYPQKSERVESPEVAAYKESPERLSWWRRRRWLLLGLGALAVVIIGLLTGLLAGLLTRHKKSSSTTTAPNSTATAGPFGTPTTFPAYVTSYPSSCRGTVCPPILATAKLGTADGAFITFARGKDNALWYRQATSEGWDASGWQRANGSLKSQPAAVSPQTGRVAVLATWDDGSVRMRTYEGSSWNGDWVNLGGNSINPPAVCSRGNGNLEVFATNGSNLLMHRSYDGSSWTPGLKEDWTVWGGYTSASAAAVCGSADRIDVVSYGGYSDSLHDVGWMHYTKSAWTGWEGNSVPASGVGYRGDPALVAADNETTSFFGIGTDKQMYHVEWSTKTNYTRTESLGGSFESTPYVFASGTSGRIDVLAVGTNDTLLHMARVGGAWSMEWEDLGGYMNSVPLFVNTEGSCAAVFGLGPYGRMIHGNFTMTDKVSWGRGTWWDDGSPAGGLSSDWYRAGPA